MSETEEKAMDAALDEETEADVDTGTPNGDEANDELHEGRQSAGDDQEGKDIEERGSAGDSDSENDEVDDDSDQEDGTDAQDEQEEDQDDSSNDGGDDDSSSSDEDDESSSDDGDEGTHRPAHVTEDGRKLSAYEIMRLERIKRNREKLAMLGLQGKEGGGVLGKKPVDPRKDNKQKKSKSPAQKRSSLSRRTKAKSVNYAEPPTSVASLLKADKEEKKKAAKDKPAKPSREPKTKDRSERMDKWIHLEFKRIKGQKTQCLKQAKRNVRLAEREIKYWKGRAEKWQRRHKRKQEAEKVVKEFERERDVLGKSAKELLQEIDGRMPELIEVAECYDNKFEVCINAFPSLLPYHLFLSFSICLRLTRRRLNVRNERKRESKRKTR